MPGIKPGRSFETLEAETLGFRHLERCLLDLGIGEDGNLRLFCRRASDAFGTEFIPDEATQPVFEELGSWAAQSGLS